MLHSRYKSPGDHVLERGDRPAGGGGEGRGEAGVDHAVFEAGEGEVLEQDVAGLDGDRGGVYADRGGIGVELPLGEVGCPDLVRDQGAEGQEPSGGREGLPGGTGVECVRRGRES